MVHKKLCTENDKHFELSTLDQNDIRESANYASEVIAIHYTHHLG